MTPQWLHHQEGTLKDGAHLRQVPIACPLPAIERRMLAAALVDLEFNVVSRPVRTRMPGGLGGAG